LFIDIDLTKTPQRPKLYLCKPNKTIIASLNEHYRASLKLNLTTLNELMFELPYKLDINHEIQHNKHCDQIKNRFLIKLILGEYTEFFIINNPSQNADDNVDFLQVNCYSLEYELKDKNIRSYKVDAVKLSEVMNGFSRDTTTVVDGISTTVTTNTDGILKETVWSLGEYPTELDSVYRSFEVSVKTKLDFILEVAEKFNLIAKFDSNLRKINFYTIDNVGINKGLRISDKRYLRTIVQNIDTETFCTRLKLYGKDGLTINSISPTGTSYIENYSYFLFPFQRDENTREVIFSSDYMSDELCHKILDYQLLLTQNRDSFPALLLTLTTKQTEMTILVNEMTVFTDAMKIIDNNIATADGSKKTIYISQKVEQQVLIDNKQIEIDNKQIEIDSVNNQITEIQTTLSYEAYFASTPELLLELQMSYQIEKDWTNQSLISPEDLYFYGLDEMEKRKNPTTIIQINMVNFLEILEEQLNWNKINLGDSISIIHKQLGIDLTARIIEVTYDFENYEIQLTISNVKSKNSKLSDILYQTTSVVDIIDISKLKWDKSQDNATEYIDQQIQEMNGTLLNLGIDIERFGNDGYITKDESQALKLTLEQAIAESEDILIIAEELEITTEADNYDNALDALTLELMTKWIGTTENPLTYPIVVTIEERNIIIGLFKDVENKKSILINAIGKARQDDGKRYVESQIAELNTALSDFQIQVNTYINAKEITEEQSDALELSKVAVQDESGDIIAIADGLLAIIGEDNILYNGLEEAKDDYYKIGTTPSGAIVTALNSVSDWLNKDSSDYPITIKPSKGVDINKKLKIAETKKNILTALITQVQIDNELTLVDQQLFEVSVAITSMQMDIKTFAKDNYITYDESVSLKASFDKILAESEDVINIANSLTVSSELINNYQNSLTGTVALNGVDGLQVELAKWVDLPLLSYAGKGLKIKSSERKLFLKKFDLVMSTKLALNNAINLLTAEYSIDGELSIRGTGANHNSARYLKLNKKNISASGVSGTGLMLTVISREDLSIIFTQLYDTYNSNEADRNLLATKLNSLDNTVIVTLTSYNSIGWNQNLLNAMIRCGGTGTDTGTGRFPFAFVGIPKLFKGTALEVFYDTGKKAPYADINTKIVDGTPQGIAVGTTLISAEATLAVQVAKANRDIVMVDITKVASNTTVTSKEKKTVKSYWDAIVSEKNTVEMQADYWNTPTYPTVATLLSNYQTAYSNLNSYISPILVDLTSSSTIVSATFINYFTLYYTNKIALLEELMVIARDYVGESISGLAEAIIALGLKITSSFNTFTISVEDSIILGTDLALVIEESRPLTDLAAKVGLSDISPNEKTNYQTALNSLQTELNNWINLSVPKSITAPQIGVIQTLYDSLQTTKTALIAKVSTLEIDNSKPNAIIATSLKLFADTLYNADNSGFQNQSVDGKIECYFYGYAPLLTNLPSIEWDTSTIKGYHVGDLFYDVVEGNAYRFSSSYLWDLIDNVDVIKVLSDSSRAQGSLDSELRIFVGTPQPPYNVQDLWRQQSNGDFKICIVERLTGSYVDSDWIYYTEYTDDVAANIAKALANKAKTDAILALEELADISDGGKITKSEKTKLKPIWDTIVVEKINYDARVLLYPSTEMTSFYNIYDNAYDAVYTYLFVTVLPNNTSNPTPILVDLTKTTNIDREEFDNKFKDYYASREDLSQFIATSAKLYADTKASYMHIAYASNSTGTSGFSFSSGTYIGIYSDAIPTASIDPIKYVWSKIVGTDGIQGPTGANGSSSYLHIKYSNNGGSTFTENNGEDPGTYIGTYTDFYYLDSSSTTSYTWAKIQDTQAMDLLTDYSDDSKLTPFEKKFISKEWDIIFSEYPQIINQTFYTDEGFNIAIGGSVTYASNYYTPAYNALASYVATLSLSVLNTTTINRNDFNTYFHDYYATKANLLYLISNGGIIIMTTP